MRMPYILSLLILCLGCGDIIKVKDPRPHIRPYQPTTLTDHTGTCPYYPGAWSGRCTGKDRDLSRVVSLDVAQNGCTWFALNSVSVFDIEKERNYKQGDKPVKSTAKWLNEERSAVEFIDELTEAEATVIRTTTIDITKGEALEKQRQVQSDGTSIDVHSCVYQRS